MTETTRVMARPKADDPLVMLPVRVHASTLAVLREIAAERGVTLTEHVRTLVAPAGTVADVAVGPARGPADQRQGAGDGQLSSGSARSAPPTRRRLLDKTEHVDLRPGAARCECEKPIVSKFAPVCTSCHRPRR